MFIQDNIYGLVKYNKDTQCIVYVYPIKSDQPLVIGADIILSKVAGELQDLELYIKIPASSAYNEKIILIFKGIVVAYCAFDRSIVKMKSKKQFTQIVKNWRLQSIPFKETMSRINAQEEELLNKIISPHPGQVVPINTKDNIPSFGYH